MLAMWQIGLTVVYRPEAQGQWPMPVAERTDPLVSKQPGRALQSLRQSGDKTES
jgi:hypothetical protein